MKKSIIIFSCIAIAVLFLFFGCDSQEQVLYKGIVGAKLPNECADVKDDPCRAFSCSVDLCWCKELPDQVLYDSETKVGSEEVAEAVVEEYLLNTNIEGFQITNSVKLNEVFYNVFVEDEVGNEITYTVSVAGEIIETVCGV